MSTKRFLLQKILQLFLTLFLVTAITFILMQLSPIDAAEAYSRRIFTVDETRIEAVREQMGLNRPIVGSALKETACIVLLRSGQKSSCVWLWLRKEVAGHGRNRSPKCE